jgi:hypothetical protein
MESMTGLEARNLIEQLGVSKSAVARCACVHDAVLYNFLDDRSISSLNKHKVVSAIVELQGWIATLPFAPSFKDWRAVQAALTEYRVKRLRAAGHKVEGPQQPKEYLPEAALEALETLGSPLAVLGSPKK